MRGFYQGAVCIGILAGLAACGGDDTGSSDGAGGTGSGSTTATTTTTTSSSATSTTSTSTTSTSTSSSTSTSTSSSSGGMSKADIKLSFQGGCAPDFSGAVVVVSNQDSVAVSTTQQPLSSIQLVLHETSGSVQLSTQERVATGDVINVIANSTTWTNVSTQMPDTIKGTLKVNHYDQTGGVIDLGFSGVVLENVQDHSLCHVDGTLVTTGKNF